MHAPALPRRIHVNGSFHNKTGFPTILFPYLINIPSGNISIDKTVRSIVGDSPELSGAVDPTPITVQ
jgi:hypothetical protein